MLWESHKLNYTDYPFYHYSLVFQTILKSVGE